MRLATRGVQAQLEGQGGWVLREFDVLPSAAGPLRSLRSLRRSSRHPEPERPRCLASARVDLPVAIDVYPGTRAEAARIMN